MPPCSWSSEGEGGGEGRWDTAAPSHPPQAEDHSPRPHPGRAPGTVSPTPQVSATPQASSQSWGTADDETGVQPLVQLFMPRAPPHLVPGSVQTTFLLPPSMAPGSGAPTPQFSPSYRVSKAERSRPLWVKVKSTGAVTLTDHTPHSLPSETSL